MYLILNILLGLVQPVLPTKNKRFYILLPASESIRVLKFYHILFYYSKKLLCQLYHTILQYSQHLNFYFTL